MDKLKNFLNSHKIQKGEVYTHTSMGSPMGSFFIDDPELKDFFHLYKGALKESPNLLHLTERHKDVGPVVIDLDFRFDPSTFGELTKKYTYADHVRPIALLVQAVYQSYIQADCTIFIFERSDTPKIVKNVVKDGIHLMLPYVITEPAIQEVIRKYIIEKMEDKDILGDLQLTNKIFSVFDKEIISKNNWCMYGSCKVGNEAYKLTHIIDHNKEEKDLSTVAEQQLVELLSIRNKKEASDFIDNDKKKNIYADYEKFFKREPKKINNPENKSVDLELIEKLVAILSEVRAENYKQWIELGWCLHNIDKRLLPVWESFSKKSPKYMPNDCEKKWLTFKDTGLGIGTLHFWASSDNREMYNKIRGESLYQYVIKACGGLSHDVAMVLYHMFKYNYVCSSLKHDIWWEFRGNRWLQCDKGIFLMKKIGVELYNEFVRVSSSIGTKITLLVDQTEQELNDAENMRLEILKHQKEAIDDTSSKLKDYTFKAKIMKEAQLLFYAEKFVERLDSNKFLLGFENGVYDLEKLEFRNGRFEDYISKSTLINYVPFDENTEEAFELKDIITKILVDEEIREFVMKLLSSCLSGHTGDEKFHIWTGAQGANGKSTLIELMRNGMGNYGITFPVTLLTKQRGSSSSASPEMARSKGARFGTFSEPEADEKINVGYLKELTGGDIITSRGLYQDPIDFKPQCHLVLMCNWLPKINGNDGGTWRRLCVVEFKSRFIDNPDPEDAYQFQRDNDLKEKLPQYSEIFISMLIEWYKIYKIQGLKPPAEVIKFTEKYRETNDAFAEFIADRCEQEPEDCEDCYFIKISEIHKAFKEWYKDAYGPSKIPDRTEMKQYLESKFGPQRTRSGNSGFQKLRLKLFNADIDSL